MKVLMFGWELPPAISGGLGTACQGLLEGLALQDISVRFVLPRTVGGERVPSGEVLAAGDVPIPKQVELVPVASPLTPYGDEASYAEAQAGADSSVGFSGGYGATLADEVRRYGAVGGELGKAADFDLVHAHDWMTFPAAAAAADASGKPLVVHVHSCEFDRAGLGADPRILAVEQAGLDRADRIVCVSGYTAGILRQEYDVDEAKLRVVHNAIRRPRRRRALRRRSPALPTVLFLGRLTRQKAPERFLEAAVHVAEHAPSTQFVMAGDGDLRPELERRAQGLGLGQSMHFPGFLAGPAVRQAFDEASVFVMPSVSEPFGLVALEAMERGVPVVLTRTSGVAEAVTSALKVDSEDVEALADRVLAVLRHPALAGQLAREGRREVATFTWKRQAARLREVYAELTV